LELYSAESWEYSRNYASLLGEIPSSFTSTIRSLLSDFEKNNNNLSSGSKYLATRLVRSSSMKAPFYYATQLYKPELLEGLESVGDDDLVKAHKPDETATLFGIIYLYKKVKKYCDSTELSFITPNLHKEISVSGQVGLAIPGVGFSCGLLTYGMRYIAACTYLKHNVKHFQEYRRLLKNEKTIFNLQKESEYFGCTIPQIASIFLQTLGFGITYANNFAMAFSNEPALTKTMPDSSPFKVAELWTKTLIETGKEPQIIHDSKYYPKSGAISSNLLAKSAAAPVYWLDKSSEDVTPEITPKLFAKKAGSEDVPKISEEIPADISAQAADLDKIDEI
jgi:hypothetical protein